MSLADRPSTLPESVYVTPDTEWSVLLTLAGAANPAEVIATGQWFEALFASEQAQTAFRRLAQGSASLALQVPSAMDGVAAFAEPAALQTARQMLVAFAQFRRLETIQAN